MTGPSQLVQAEKLFEKLAADTWSRVSDAYSLGMTVGEETITDMIALDVRRARLPGIEVRKISKGDEAVRGADWDLWIGSQGCGWLRYAVQAKRLYLPSARYQSLRHRASDGLVPQWQIERLERFASSQQAIPIYCLYNGAVSMTSIPNFARQQSRYGCTVASLETMKRAHERRAPRSFHWVHEQANVFPWAELVRNHCSWLSDPKVPRFIGEGMRHPSLPREVVSALAFRPDDNPIGETESESGATGRRGDPALMGDPPLTHPGLVVAMKVTKREHSSSASRLLVVALDRQRD